MLYFCWKEEVALKEYLWIFPFISFLVGYFLLSSIYYTKRLETPSLIGKSLKEAVALASAKNVNIRLIEEREDTELPEGTIIVQNPQPPLPIKPNQTLFCVASKKPIILIPDLLLKPHDIVVAELKERGIHSVCNFIESIYPKGSCFAQSPRPQAVLEIKLVNLYISADSQKLVLFPNLKHKPVNEVIEFFRLYNLTPSIIHYPPRESHDCNCDRCIIVDQRPLAGSIVALDQKRPLSVQLQVH